MARPRRRRDPQALRRLEKATSRYRRELEAAERQLAEVQRRRDDAIRAAAEAGVPHADIGQVVGVSAQRVGRIVRQSR